MKGKKRTKFFKFPLAKVKKIIQKNEEIGKIDRTIPFIICKPKSLQYSQIAGVLPQEDARKAQGPVRGPKSETHPFPPVSTKMINSDN